MRKILSLVLCLLVFGACSNTADTNTGYEHELGTTVVKDNPKVVSDYYVGELLKLDVNLVGAPLTYKSPTWDVKGITEIGDSMDKIASLQPDLIITINKDKYDKYSAIAPTIYLEYGKMDPIETMHEFGKVFNKTQEVTNWEKDFKNSTDQLKEKIVNPDQTYTIMKLWDRDIWLYGNNWGHGGFIIYDMLGLKADEDIQKDVIDSKKGYLNISLENIDKYSGDVILAMDFNDNNSIIKSKVFKSLDAVKNDNIHYLDSLDYFHVDPISLDYQVEKLSEILTNEK